MFRFNNPDALLTLLLVGAAYATIRAIEAGRTAYLAGIMPPRDMAAPSTPMAGRAVL